MPGLRPAPEFDVVEWLGAPAPITLAGLHGRVVVIEAFQMLCPGCVQVGLPQAARIRETFAHDDVVVLGLHTVFEHHEAQGTRLALEAFLHEYRYAFPVGMDRPGESGGIPRTMAAYAMQGTPTLVLVDRQGRLRRRMFGHIKDLRLGAEIEALIGETDATLAREPEPGEAAPGCTTAGCAP